MRRKQLMGRFLLKRFGLALITLFLLSVIAFAAAQLLPGNVGLVPVQPEIHGVDEHALEASVAGRS